MDYNPFKEEEELEVAMPDSSIAGPQTPRDQVMARIAEVRSGGGSPNDPAVEFARQSQLTSGIGRGLNALAAGTGYRPDNSGYDAIDKGAQDALARSAAVRKAVEDRKGKEAALQASLNERAIDNRRADEALALRRDDIALRREERADNLAQKRNDKELSLAVPGYERTGDVLPKAEEAQKFREATADASQLTSKLNRLRELVNKYGSFEWGGEAGQEMSSLATEIQLLSKSPSMYSLGVLTGPDLEILKKITADPSDMSSLFTRDSTRKAQINAQLASIENKLASKAASLGYRSAPSSEKGLAGGGVGGQQGGGGFIPDAHAGSGRVTVTNGSETYSIELKDLPDAQADGFQVVK